MILARTEHRDSHQTGRELLPEHRKVLRERYKGVLIPPWRRVTTEFTPDGRLISTAKPILGQEDRTTFYSGEGVYGFITFGKDGQATSQGWGCTRHKIHVVDHGQWGQYQMLAFTNHLSQHNQS